MTRPTADHLRAPARVQLDASGSNRFRMSPAYSGARVTRFWGDAVFDLDGIRVPPSVEIRMNHDPDQVLGRSTSAKVTASGLQVAGLLYAHEPLAATVQQRSRDGHPYGASIGVTEIKWLDVPDGSSLTVNGVEHEGPLSVATSCRLSEVSFTAEPADVRTHAQALSADDLAARRRAVEAWRAEQAALDVDPDPVEAALDQQLGRGTEADQRLRRRPPNAPDWFAELTADPSRLTAADRRLLDRVREQREGARG